MATQSIYYAPGTQPIVFAAAGAAWVHNTAYLTGILVTNGGNTYFCLVGHTSTNDAGTGFATDLAAGKWLLVTPIVWTPGTTPLAITKTRVSAVWDRGAGHQPAEFEWFASTKWATTVALGDALRLYLIKAYGANNNPALTQGYQTFGDADLAATTDVLGVSGCEMFGTVRPGSATDQLWLASGTVDIEHRYIGLGGYNASAAKALTSVASDHWVLFNQIPPAIQAAV